MSKAKDFSQTAANWLRSNERFLLIALFLVHAFLFFVVHGEVRLHWDSPGYTDPVINYLNGNGFNSSCWYAQPWDAYWAGNTPLHQFLLIPWFKAFGVSYVSLLWLNYLYTALGVMLIWLALKQSGLIQDGAWRLGAVAFILFTDRTYNLVAAGRHDPLSFLLVSLAAICLTFQRPALRFGALLLPAVLLPWTHLAICAYAATMGLLLLTFYPKQFWKEVLVFGTGGVLGSLALFGFYKHHQVWDGFLSSIAPHSMGGAVNTSAHWRFEGITESYTLPYLAAGILAFLIAALLRRQPLKFSLFATACMAAVPAFLIKLGVFSCNYGWCLLFLVVVLLFVMLAREPFVNRYTFLSIIVLLAFGVVIPGNFLRKTIKNRLIICQSGEPKAQVDAFVKKVLNPKDVAWVNEIFYYQTKQLAYKTISCPVAFATFGGQITYPGRLEDLNSVTVCIWDTRRDGKDQLPKELPGRWTPTGDALNVWDKQFLVYRRTDQPIPSLTH